MKSAVILYFLDPCATKSRPGPSFAAAGRSRSTRFTLRLRHLWYWYFCLRLSKKCTLWRNWRENHAGGGCGGSSQRGWQWNRSWARRLRPQGVLWPLVSEPRRRTWSLIPLAILVHV